MNLFRRTNKKNSSKNEIFNKDEVIREIFETKDENCPGWKFFGIKGAFLITPDLDYYPCDRIQSDFLAIYTDLIYKEIKISKNPYSDYKNIVPCTYQIVREIYITDNEDELLDDSKNNSYKILIAKSAKEFFIKLKREQE